MQDDDYVVYRSSAERLLAHKEKILLAELKDVKEYGISQQTLYNIQRALRGGKIELKDKTIRRLLAYLAAGQ